MTLMETLKKINAEKKLKTLFLNLIAPMETTNAQLTVFISLRFRH